MGNLIVMDYDDRKLVGRQKDAYLKMSNGGTDIFLQSMALSGSRIAGTTKQMELIIWLSEHDQSVYGRGAVGFALSDIPFNASSYTEEKEFLLDVLDGMDNKLGWSSWETTPNEEFLLQYAQTFREMLYLFDDRLIDPSMYHKWKLNHFDRSWIIEDYYQKKHGADIEWWVDRYGATYACYANWAHDAHHQVDRAEKIFAEHPLCEMHGTLLTVHGCIVCNDI